MRGIHPAAEDPQRSSVSQMWRPLLPCIASTGMYSMWRETSTELESGNSSLSTVPITNELMRRCRERMERACIRASLPTQNTVAATVASPSCPEHDHEEVITHAKFPDARDVYGSFYPTRHSAVEAWRFGSGGGSSDLITIAVDRPNTTSQAKMFQCIPRRQLTPFLKQFRDALQRNVYVLVDDVHPCDAFVDVDCSFDRLPLDYVTAKGITLLSSNNETSETSRLQRHGVMYDILLHVLRVLETSLTAYFEEKRQSRSDRSAESNDAPSCPRVRIERTVVLGANACDHGKISFHIHMRVQELSAVKGVVRSSSGDTADHDPQQTPVAFQSILELKEFFKSFLMHRLEECAPHQRATGAGDRCSWSLRDLMTAVLDLSVYSRWRAFRLPFCIKAIDVESECRKSLMDAMTRCNHEGEEDTQTIPFSSIAALSGNVSQIAASIMNMGNMKNGICVACHADNQRLRHECSTMVLRPLLPVTLDETPDAVPCSSDLATLFQSLRVLTSGSVEEIVDMCTIVRPRSDFSRRGGEKRAREGEEEGGATWCSDEEPSDDLPTGSSVVSLDGTAEDFALDRTSTTSLFSPGTPFPVGRRISVSTMATKQLVWELFQCLHPTAFQSLRPEHLNVIFEDAGGQRYWYVYQKQSRYCLHLHRPHKQTFGQLYITYGSIKFRCYSNDCCQKPCVRVFWQPEEEDAQEHVSTSNNNNEDAEYSKKKRAEMLMSIRDKLFPPLPPTGHSFAM